VADRRSRQRPLHAALGSRLRDMDSEPILAAASAASIEVTREQPQPHKWLVAAAVLLGGILTILDGSIVNVALPYMQRSFGVGVDQISWWSPATSRRSA